MSGLVSSGGKEQNTTEYNHSVPMSPNSNEKLKTLWRTSGPRKLKIKSKFICHVDGTTGSLTHNTIQHRVLLKQTNTHI